MSSNNTDDLVNESLSSVSDASSEQNGYQDWHSRFNLGLGELLPNWSVFSPFRRRASKSQSAPQSPGKSCLPKESPEQIELVQFPNSKASESLWKNVHSKLATPGDVFPSNIPVMVGSKAFTSISEENPVASIPPAKEEGLCVVSLKKLAAFLWEEPSDGQGVGHDFVMSQSSNPTWCDKCGDLLWGLYQAKYMRCQYCHYTCHPQCRDLVTLDCRAVEAESLDQRDSLSISEGKEASDDLDSEITEDESMEGEPSSINSADVSGTQTPEKVDVLQRQSQEELRRLVADYTAAAPPGLGMTLEENGSTFRGFIRVHLNLSRPISVVAGSRPPSIYDILKEDETLEKTLTSFYLPRDTVKALHVTSETTTHEVVVALLKKFKVVDNPRKFALYERYYEDSDVTRVKMRRIGENEKPLALALQWSQETDCNKMFVLQENETEDILWEAFTLPELGNFLRILDREEEEYKKRVQQKYQLIASKLQEAMDQLKSVDDVNIMGNKICDNDQRRMERVLHQDGGGS